MTLDFQRITERRDSIDDVITELLGSLPVEYETTERLDFRFMCEQ